MSSVKVPVHDQTPSAPDRGRAEQDLLSVTAIAKAFGPTRALRDCSFALRAGEVHAIVGENGSGKSTLVKILAGVHRPDAGVVELDGTPRRPGGGPRAVHQAGIFTVFQEVLVVASRSVLDNVWLGSDGLLRRGLPEAEKRRRARAVLTELLDSEIDLDAPAETLSLSGRQACCVARALLREPRILILDESTSALDVATRDHLFTAVRRLCVSGAGVIFISHRMDEIQELADRVTVLRSGESVVTLDRVQATTEALVFHMTGEDHLTAGVHTVAPRARVRGDVVLRAESLRLVPHADPVEITVHAGELIGLAGLEGHGQDTFLHALRGADVSFAGRVICGDRALSSPAQAMSAGVAYVPRDRRGEAVFPTLSITENFALPTMAQDQRAGLLAPRSAARRLLAYVDQLGIRMGSPRQPITALSGGNQQKVIVARWLAARPRVLLLNDPTRGVDLNAKRDLYELLERIASDGVAVVMLSSEVDEHVELMDRVLVFREQTVSAELDREHLTRSALVAAFFGRSEIHV
jgi:ABC-type sugar transport system ATPase subunit